MPFCQPNRGNEYNVTDVNPQPPRPVKYQYSQNDDTTVPRK